MGFQGGTGWVWPDAGDTELIVHTTGYVPEWVSPGLALPSQGPLPGLLPHGGDSIRLGGGPQLVPQKVFSPGLWQRDGQMDTFSLEN